MAVLLLAEVNSGELALDATAKAVTAAKALGDVTALCCGASAAAAGTSGRYSAFGGSLSGGFFKKIQKKDKLALADYNKAIALNPKYLFCDEPNSGLDPKTAIVIDNLIKEITEEKREEEECCETRITR